MGKKGRRMRWRTLAIPDEHSDSEESNTTSSGHHMPKGYKTYYSKFSSYSSQSTPTRRFDCSKSTRSSSTASENKITFNEDEYTRITTPRQDVLFKKGYLNKPRTYQTQTSTGNSTTSTGNNSTGNGTPDHQSTGDLEYESQFVFPNGFVDQNGIYYVNSFEPYPMMVFNPPTYYPEYTNVKEKRSSTGSLTESSSPNNEETSQENLQPVYNIVYPVSNECYYGNGELSQRSQEEEEPRRVKKRRKRKQNEETAATSGEETNSEKEEEEEKNENVEEIIPKTEYKLKPDAEEFVPMAYRNNQAIENIQYIKLPPNFVPVPLTIGDFNAFIPAGIPINFIPHHPSTHQNFVNYMPPYDKPDEEKNEKKTEETCTSSSSVEEKIEVPCNQIDIAKIVSKLEEAAKEQEEVKKEENLVNMRQTRRKLKYQKVELRSNNERKQETSPKKVVKQEKPQEECKKPVRNYSDTLKKSFVPTERLNNGKNHTDSKIKLDKSPKKEVCQISKNVKVEERIPKVAGEWISVSSRKKRRPKNVEEFEEEEEVEEVKINNVEEVEVKVTIEEVTPVLEESLPEEDQIEEQEMEEEKRKTKKNNKKPVTTKRVIIKDIDLSEPKEEVEESKEVVKTETKIEEEESRKEVEKKTKRKKNKKVKNLVINNEDYNITNITNPTDDSSYDFLLDKSIDKTNVEISQELDRLIQRATFNSLEEKIKSLSVSNDDADFFASIIGNISTTTKSRESSTEPQHYLNNKPRLPSLSTPPVPVGVASEAYPITRAVKEWVSKKRENTPDVEIFKSPSAILREFGEEEDDENEEEEEEEEENKDEKERVKYPHHGNLPYRAICCSIM